MEMPVTAVTSKEDYLPFREYRTWYRITGSLDSGKLPLVVAHGGPGCTHDYVDSFKDISPRSMVAPSFTTTSSATAIRHAFRKRVPSSGRRHSSSKNSTHFSPISA
jgi:hypothetical protein